MVVEYAIERRLDKAVKNRKWFFLKEYEEIPVWCLVKYSSDTCYESDYEYEEVLIKSQDEDYIKQEFKNFTEGLK